MLTRIYGIAFPSKQELDDYLKMMEEAEKRDHRNWERAGFLSQRRSEVFLASKNSTLQ